MEIPVLEHIACNVERGYVPQRGVGFQTVALSEPLLGTEDLLALEEMAPYYEITSGRRQTTPLPVRESLFRLPSGRMALSRTVDWGTDPHGRLGNYLWHALVLPAEPAAAAWDAFQLLTAARAGEPGTDLTPRLLPARSLPSTAAQADLKALQALSAPFLGKLVASLDGAQTPLLLGPEPSARLVINSLRALLPTQERSALTFSTHFYHGCHALREKFRLTAAGSLSEAPNDPSAYRAFDLTTGEIDAPVPDSALGRLFTEVLAQGRPQPLEEFSRLADGIRSGSVAAGTSLPGTTARLALWDCVGKPAIPFLAASSPLLVELLRAPETPRPLADALLEYSTPARLRAEGEEAAQEAAAALQAAASPAAWRSWRKTWAKDALFAPQKRQWWAFWRAGAPTAK